MQQISSSTTERVLSAGGVAAIIVGALAVRYFDLANAGLLPQCPFHSLTGLNCPGCGLTRGVNAAMNGDFLGAIHFNALLPIYAFVFLYFILSLILIAVRGRGLSWAMFSPGLIYAFIALSLIYAVARNLPMYPFNLLAI